MEYVPCGSLEAQIKKGMIPSHKIWKYFRGLILGMEYCHEKAGVVHRDIKPENLLIDVNDNIKITDFGISFMMDYASSDEISVMAGSHFFMAPEVVSQERYKGKPSDIWAMGVTLYYMLCRKLPFCGTSIPNLYNSIVKSEPSYDVFFTTEQSNLLRRMMCKDPDNRITLNELKIDPWVTKCGAFLMQESKESPIVISYAERMMAMSQLKIITHIKKRLQKKVEDVRRRLAAKKSL